MCNLAPFNVFTPDGSFDAYFRRAVNTAVDNVRSVNASRHSASITGPIRKSLTNRTTKEIERVNKIITLSTRSYFVNQTTHNCSSIRFGNQNQSDVRHTAMSVRRLSPSVFHVEGSSVMHHPDQVQLSCHSNVITVIKELLSQ